jgi:long-subunit fatty acid transport protein
MLPSALAAGRLNARGKLLFMPVRVRSAMLGAALLLGGGMASAQTPQPSALPPQLGQDELDLQARANVVQGSGARALGMGGAFLARADDATAASWNPAGLSYLRLPEMSFVYSGGRLEGTEVTAGGRKVDNREGHTPDFFAAAYPFQVRGLSGSAQVSFQRLIPFGGERTILETLEDPDTGAMVPGRPTEVRSAGGFDVVALGTGVTLRGNIRMGATVNRWFNGYNQTLDRDTVRGGIPGHTTQQSAYDLRGWNLNLGLMWSPREELNVGAVYKSAFTADMELNKSRVDITVPSTSNQASSTSLGAPMTLDFPAAVGVGASWRPRSRLTMSADYTRTFWSEGVIRNYFTLPQPVAGATPQVLPSLPYPTLDPRLPQQDTVQVRGGVEYVFILGRVKLPVRAGAFRDRQYVESIDGSSPTFTGLTAGTGVAVGPVLVDVAFIHERGDYDTLTITSAPTAASVRSQRIVGSVIYRLPRH